MQVNKLLLMANVNKSQVSKTDTHYKITGIPITVDDAVMNDVHYPAHENEKGMNSMVGKPLTIGHPVDDKGNYLSGREGIGMQNHYSGGNITRTYNVKGVWYADAEIKTALLNAQESGPELIQVLDNKQDLGVSTGLLFSQNEVSGVNGKGDSFEMTAINQEFDHLAALLNETPAGGSDTVARFNSEEVPTIHINELIDSMTSEQEEGLFKRLYNRFIPKVDDLITKRYNESTTNINVNEDEEPEMDKSEVEQLLQANNDTQNKALADIVATAVNSALEPIKTELETVKASVTANADKEHADLVEKANALDIIDKETLLTMNTEKLTAFVAKHSGSPAGGINANSLNRGQADELDAEMPE